MEKVLENMGQMLFFLKLPASFYKIIKSSAQDAVGNRKIFSINDLFR